MRFSLLCSSVVVLTLVAACGSKNAAPPPQAGCGKHVDAATAGRVSGRVVFQGAPPPVQLVKMAADPACSTGGDSNVQSDAVLVSQTGGLQNVFVQVKDGLDPAYSFDVPSTPVILDQKGCRYAPRIFGVRVGQTLHVVNTDETMHNVHALPKVNREYNKSTPVKGTRTTQTFTVPETMVRFKCDVHGWMTAYAGVVAHPFFAVTGADGSFDIEGLPPGTYTIEAWHERFGVQTQQVTIGDRQAQTVSFTFSAPKS